MARILIRQAHGGQTRIISDPALPYFLNQGWVVLDDYDDAEDIPPVYLSRAEGDLRWASITDLGDPESAEVVVISEAVADILVDPATGPGADLRAVAVAAVEDATTVAPTGGWDFTQAPTVAGEPIAPPPSDLRAFNIFAPQNYGAVGDAVTDDSPAFQAAFDAAAAVGGTVLIPAPDVQYRLTSTVTVQPQGASTQFRMNILGSGKTNAIQWDGAADTPVFRLYGLKRSMIDGVHVSLAGGANGVIAWDIDTTSVYVSTSLVTFNNCFVELGTTTGVGWRLGHVSAGIADISFYSWINCNVNGNGGGGGAVTGSRGWVIAGANTLNNYWYGGFITYLDKGVTNLSDAGATSGSGNDSMLFYGLGSSHNNIDFQFAAPGAYLISGGRFEVGKRFIDVTTASNHAAVTVQGVNISTYTPSDNILVNFARPGTLIWDGNYIKGTTHTAAAFTFSGFTGLGNAMFRGGAIQGSDPFWSTNSQWNITVADVGILNSSQQTTARMGNRVGIGYIDLPGTTLPTAAATERGRIRVTEGGSGVADTLSVCLKDAAGAYSWKTIATG